MPFVYALLYLLLGLITAYFLDALLLDRIMIWPDTYKGPTRLYGQRFFLSFWLWPAILPLIILYVVVLFTRDCWEH